MWSPSARRPYDCLTALTYLVAHILYNALERGGSLVSPIGRSLRDLQVEETRQWQVGWERVVGGLWWRLAEYRGLWQEKAGDDYPVVPVGAHGGRRESGGGQSGPSKSCDDVITRASSGKPRDLVFSEVSPDTILVDPSTERSQISRT